MSAEPDTALLELGGPVSGAHRLQIWKQRPDFWPGCKNFLDLNPESNLRRLLATPACLRPKNRRPDSTYPHPRLAVTAEQVAWVINCQPYDVPVLMAARLLKPLGNAPPNSVKYFSAGEVLEQMRDRAWLVRVTNAINEHWRQRNERKRCASVECAGVTEGGGNGRR